MASPVSVSLYWESVRFLDAAQRIEAGNAIERDAAGKTGVHTGDSVGKGCGVDAIAADQGVVIRSALEKIVPRTAIQGVAAVATLQKVIAVAAGENIRPAVTNENVVEI